MATSNTTASRSRLFDEPREAWLALRQEDIIDPERPIVDAHHHLWDRGGQRYMIEEITGDIASGHNIVATVFVHCRSMYRAGGPEAFRPVGEIEFVNGVAAMSASGGYGSARAVRRHRRPRRSSAGRSRHARFWKRKSPPATAASAASGMHRRGMPMPASAASTPPARRPVARPDVSRGLCLPRATGPEFRCVAVSSADRRTHRSGPHLSRHAGSCSTISAGRSASAATLAGARRFSPVWQASIRELAGMPQCHGETRRTGDAATGL